MSLIKKLPGETALYGLSSILGRFLGYLLVPMYTRTLTKVENGVLAELYAYSAFLIVVLSYGLESAFFRYGTPKEDRDQSYSTALLSLFGSTLAILLVILGLTLFIHGLKVGLFPIGESMAHDFARKGSLFWLLAFAFALGFGTTVAEPALIAVTDEASKVAATGGMIADTDESRHSYAYGLRLTVALSGMNIAVIIQEFVRGTRARMSSTFSSRALARSVRRASARTIPRISSRHRSRSSFTTT